MTNDRNVKKLLNVSPFYSLSDAYVEAAQPAAVSVSVRARLVYEEH